MWEMKQQFEGDSSSRPYGTVTGGAAWTPSLLLLLRSYFNDFVKAIQSCVSVTSIATVLTTFIYSQ